MNHFDRNQIIQNLARLRREWNEAAQGQPLDEVAQALVLGSQPAAERRYGLSSRPAPQYEPVAV